MKNINKLILLALLIMFALQTEAFSQSTNNEFPVGTFEYAFISTSGSQIIVEYGSGESEVIKLEKGEFTNVMIAKELESLNTKGWELVDLTSNQFGNPVILIKRKK